MMTLAGIAVAIGRVIDDSIVVIENVFRRVRKSKQKDAELIEESTHEVAIAITSSTLTTVAVFIPLAFVPGIVGKFFAPLAWTIVISLLFSLIVAVTVVPLFSKLFILKLPYVEHKENLLQKAYRRMLHWALNHRLITLGISITILIGSAVIPASGLIGFNFLPSDKAISFNIDVDMPVGTSSSKTDKQMEEIEKILESYEDVHLVVTGVSEEYGRITFMVNDETDIEQLETDLREKFSQFNEPESIVLVGLGGMRLNPSFSIVINGPNMDVISEAADEIVDALTKVDGLADVRTSLEGEKPEINIDFNEDSLTEHGLTPIEVALSLRTMIEGNRITTIDYDDEPTDVYLQLHSDNLDKLNSLKEQEITNIFGQPVKLGELGEVKQTLGKTKVAYLDYQEYIEVYATITDDNQSKVTSNAFAAIHDLELPPGVSLTSEGAAKEMNEGFINMGIAIIISIILVYFVMLLAFGEALMPLVILSAIPFSIIGSIAGLFLLDEPIGMPAMIGLLMLNGIVVTNAIVLLDRVKRNELSGMNQQQALMEGGVTRLRPILMTAIATIAALLPLAISNEAGIISRSLAVVVIGGLTSSTVLTLIIVPVIYSLVNPLRKKKVA